MATDVYSSALDIEINRIITSGGSPYYRLGVEIHCGGKSIIPLQVLRLDIQRDYRDSYMDATSIVVALGLGTVMREIAPFQDDIKLTLRLQNLSETGTEISDTKILSRTYKAYIGDEVPKGIEAANNPIMQEMETANRNKIKYVCFVLEEVALEQLRKMPFGMIVKATPPWMVMKTIFSRAHSALKLADDEVVRGIEMSPANNQEARNHIVIRDGTPLLDIPDLLQNDHGGIYSSGLGFYIQDQYLYFWPLYNTKRQSEAKRVLHAYISPTRHGVMIDKTWMDNGRSVSIYCAGQVKMIDDSLGALNNEGNAVRYTDSRRLLDGFGTVENNKVTVSRTLNNNEFAGVSVGNQQNQTKLAESKITSNVYLEASKLAKRAGVILILPWRRSNPNLLTPGMAAEVYFDYDGEVRTMEGCLLGVYNSMELDGRGLTAQSFISTSAIVLFIDRNDPDFKKFIDSGGVVSAAPQIDEI